MNARFVGVILLVLSGTVQGLRVITYGQGSAGSEPETRDLTQSLTMDSEDFKDILEDHLKDAERKPRHAGIGGCGIHPFLQEVQALITPSMQQSLLSTFAEKAISAFVIMSTGNYMCQFDNWLSHAEAVAPDETVVHFSLDNQNHQFCETRAKQSSMTVKCLNMTGLIPGMQKHVKGASDVQATHDMFELHPCNWKHITWLKPFLLFQVANIMTSDSNVLLTDVDIVQRGNLLKLCREEYNDSSLVVQAASPNNTRVRHPYNSGFLYVKESSRDALQGWLDVGNRVGYIDMDQDGLEDYLKEGRQLDVVAVPNDIIGNLGEIGSYATHFNGLNQGSKVQRMKRQNLWKPKSESCK